MIVCVAGSRNITEYEIVDQAILESKFEITELISGGAKGIDSVGETWAFNNSIPTKIFKAKWKRYGKSAGYKRNLEMMKYVRENSGALIAIYDGISAGTRHALEIAEVHDIPTFLVIPRIILKKP